MAQVVAIVTKFQRKTRKTVSEQKQRILGISYERNRTAQPSIT